MKKTVRIIFCLFFSIVIFTSGCEKNSVIKVSDYTKTSKSSEKLSDFSFDTILVYCSPSLVEPVFEVKKIFENATGCEVQVNVAEKTQIHNQIKSSKIGEVYIADSEYDFEDISKFVRGKKNIAVHTPCLAVRKGDFPGADNLNALIEKRITFLTAGFDTAIGNISEKFFEVNSDKIIFDYICDISENELYSSVYENENCAAIIWKENSQNKNVDTIEIKELDEFSSQVTSAMLKTSISNEAAVEFMQFLGSEEVKVIFYKYGFGIV